MKKYIRTLMAMLLFLTIMMCHSAIATTNFSEDVQAMNNAAQSVVLLKTFDENNSPVATASGFFVFDSMTIVTNYHVIKGAYSVQAIDENNHCFDVSLIYRCDKDMDIAILRIIEPSTYRPLELADANKAQKGEKIVAIGSPLGIKNTLSTGIISGINDLSEYREILFSAPISSGSSGGALFNDQGQVIGITSASFEDGQNLNYAISSNAIQALMELSTPLLTIREHYQSVKASQISTIHSGELTIAIDACPPLQYMNDKGNLTGFEIEMIETIAKKLSLEVAYVILPFEELLTSLHSASDCIVAGMEYVEERAHFAIFTNPYATFRDEWGDWSPVIYVDKSNVALKEAINQALAEMKTDGTIQRIAEAFGTEIY
ncbi:MAG: transporter substrate-binding domain-containing protein [Carnobacterium sp.]